MIMWLRAWCQPSRTWASPDEWCYKVKAFRVDTGIQYTGALCRSADLLRAAVSHSGTVTRSTHRSQYFEELPAHCGSQMWRPICDTSARETETERVLAAVKVTLQLTSEYVLPESDIASDHIWRARACDPQNTLTLVLTKCVHCSSIRARAGENHECNCEALVIHRTCQVPRLNIFDKVDFILIRFRLTANPKANFINTHEAVFCVFRASTDSELYLFLATHCWFSCGFFLSLVASRVGRFFMPQTGSECYLCPNVKWPCYLCVRLYTVFSTSRVRSVIRIKNNNMSCCTFHSERHIYCIV